MENIIIISDKKGLDRKIKVFREQGISKIHIVADFDRTLTKEFVNGKKIPSVISILRDEGYLTKDYPGKARALFDKYHPIEIDPDYPLERKKKKMDEWWKKHFELLIKSKLNKSDLANVVNSENMVIRKGAGDFISLLNELNIPLIIISSSGLGWEAIEMLFEREKLLFDNIEIISNKFEWDNNGFAAGVKEPIIHVFNKDEAVLKELPEIYEKIADKKNVVLIGDSFWDLGMIEGFDYANLIKIGFLNECVEENLEEYKKNFDVIITGDGDFSYINRLMSEII